MKPTPLHPDGHRRGDGYSTRLGEDRMARVRTAPRSFLHHGVNSAGELVPVEAVERGRTSLVCPYCAIRLIAKKGRVLASHFAHDGPTCREASEQTAARVPLYDDFATLDSLGSADLRLCAQLLRRTINHTSLRGWRRASLARLVEAALIEEVPRGQRWVNGVGSHRHTKWGEQIAAATRYRLSLKDLAGAQERAALEKLDRLERESHGDDARGSLDLRLYRAQLERLFSLDLYLLRVRADRTPLYKIGVTSRSVEERLPEIRQDLGAHYDDVALEVEGCWPRRGSLELYFKRVFERRQVRIGSLTEYFSFEGYRRPFSMLAKLDSTLSPRLEALIATS